MNLNFYKYLLIVSLIFFTKVKTENANWSVFTYMQADNSLDSYAGLNMQSISNGIASDSTKTNFIVQLDLPNTYKTFRYKINKNNVINDVGTLNQEMGVNPVLEMIDAATWLKTNFPANNYLYLLWNHGSGVEDDPIKSPKRWFFQIPGVEKEELEERGILYDDSTSTFVTTPDLETAFNAISKIFGSKIAIIGMDACLMQMIEVAYQIKNYANYMVASQEVIDCDGFNYQSFTNYLTKNPTKINAKAFATNIVQTYGTYYKKRTNYYTLSCVDLNQITNLVNNINSFVKAFNDCKIIDSTSMKSILSKARQKSTSFYISRYIDLGSFYNQMLTQIISTKTKTKNKSLKTNLSNLQNVINSGKNIISKTVISKVAGKNYSQALGISIYYPASNSYIHDNYLNTKFAQETQWLNFLKSNR